MKIALVITGLGVGGAERVVVDLAESFTALGHTVNIFYLKGTSIIKPKDPSIVLVGLGFNSWIDIFPSVWALITYLRTFEPDVVHTHLFHANILTRLIRPFAQIRRLITTAHTKSESWFRMFAYRLTDSLADITTNVCDEAVNSFIENKASKPGRIITVYNGISTNLYKCKVSKKNKVRSELGITHGQNIILAVGRLHEQKDYSNFLAAISLITFDRSKYKVFIAGIGNLYDELQILSNRLGVNDLVRFLGLRHDIPDLMSAADVFVLSSAIEGFPMVVGEAMSSECLVVATDCGGVKEFLGDTGLIVPPKKPDDLARMLDFALAMPQEMREAYGRSARTRIEQLFSLDAAVNKWISIYTAESTTESV